MKIIVDKDIPFIQGRLEPFGSVIYAAGDKISTEMVKDAEALIVRTRTKCGAPLLNGSKVKLVSTATIGTDHIDNKWCSENGIEVMSSPGCNAPGVATYVISSLLLSGFRPDKDILGIIGYGNVGSLVGRWAESMNIKIKVCDPLRQKAGFKDCNYVVLEELLNESNAVTLHVPLTKDGEYPTCRLIDRREIELMKPGTLLINTSRGGIVNEKELLDYLKNKKLKAVIDVWENEPQINLDLLRYVEYGTPHIAGYSKEGKIRATRMALENFDRFFSVTTDKTGLETPSVPTTVSASKILDSYKPNLDSERLKQNPDSFESLRNNYAFRSEP
ncbi:MAG: 4-phosphoerythronate dehydrogenase [Muribaculaceae bacterium]|nr:4-phosphoerythronate dehydrogenase [Muribaculaceae bacterium]